MRPAQCRTLVLAICLISKLKGLKKPPPAHNLLSMTTELLLGSRAHRNDIYWCEAQDLQLVKAETPSAHPQAKAADHAHLQDPLC